MEKRKTRESFRSRRDAVTRPRRSREIVAGVGAALGTFVPDVCWDVLFDAHFGRRRAAPVSGAIVAHLLHDPHVGLERADLVVQWELAKKHTAVWPATLRGTYWRAWFELTIAGRLARSAFSPAPAVDAAVLRIRRRTLPRVSPEDHAVYWRFVRDAFRGQAPLEKALRPRLTPREVRRLSALLGFAPGARPRDLDARQWAEVYAFAKPSSAASTRVGRVSKL